MTGVWVSDADSALGTRVLGRLAGSAGLELARPELCDVAIYLGAADPDARARRRESITAGAAEAFDALATATHLVVVSSAMVYGAWENNPVPLTEDAVLRPGNEFAYASQVAAMEQLADDWRRSRAGRTVAVLRPAVATGFLSSWPHNCRWSFGDTGPGGGVLRAAAAVASGRGFTG